METNPRWRRYARLFGPDPVADVKDELQFHIDSVTDELIAEGLSPDEARREAARRLGDLRQLQRIGSRIGARTEQRRRLHEYFQDALQDLRYTFRGLRRDPAFTAICVLILALGIGANIAVFSVVNALLLRPLPFPHAEQLIRIIPKDAVTNESGRTYTADFTEDYQRENRAFQSLSGYFNFTTPNNFKLSGRGQPLPATGMLVAEGFFETLGVHPVIGRPFRPEEFKKHAPVVALLSYPFWKARFGGDTSIVGRTVDLKDPVDLGNSSVTVIGVLPDSFDFGSVFAPGARVDLFVPYIMDDFRNDGNDLALVARLKTGVTIAQAQNDIDSIFPRLYYTHSHPEYGKGYTGIAVGLKDYVSGKLHRSLVVLWCAVGLILLIVCVNLSNLLLARAAARTREFAVRSALGAKRSRTLRQLLTESFVLSAAGAVLGLGIAWALLSYLAHQGSIALPLLRMVRLDGAALGWTLLVAVGAAVLFGTMPALRMSSVNLQEALKDGGHGTSEGRRHDRLRSTLVITEIALACVLLAGAGLLLRSFLHVLDVDLGFEPSRAAAVSVDYDDGGNSVKRALIWQNVVDHAAHIPGVQAAGISDNLPMSRSRGWSIAPKGDHKPLDREFIGAFVYIVSPGYLKAMGMRLIEGRDLTWDDMINNRSSIVINASLARKLWPGQDPLGRHGLMGNTEPEVVGVIADVHETSAEDDAGTQMYLPANKQWGPEGSYLVVRSTLAPDALASSVMSTLREINPGQPASEFLPIQGLVDHSVSPRRFFVLLVGVFAGLGLLLAALGIYGLISYSVTQQTQEIGVRMALGAASSRIQRDIIVRTLRFTLIGIVVGTGVSILTARLIAALLFATSPWDGGVYISMILVLIAVALVSGYLPARRASRINPMAALRNQ